MWGIHRVTGWVPGEQAIAMIGGGAKQILTGQPCGREEYLLPWLEGSRRTCASFNQVTNQRAGKRPPITSITSSSTDSLVHLVCKCTRMQNKGGRDGGLSLPGRQAVFFFSLESMELFSSSLFLSDLCFSNSPISQLLTGR